MSSYVPPNHEVWATNGYGSLGVGLELTDASLGRFFRSLFELGGSLQSLSPPLQPRDGAWLQAQLTLPAGARRQMEELSGISLEAPCGGFSSA